MGNPKDVKRRKCIVAYCMTLQGTFDILSPCTCSFSAWQYWKNTGLVSGGGNGRTDTCMPYSLPKCDHHVEGPYGPCPPSTNTPSCEYQVWSLTQLYSVDFFQLRIGVKKCVFNKRTTQGLRQLRCLYGVLGPPRVA